MNDSGFDAPTNGEHGPHRLPLVRSLLPRSAERPGLAAPKQWIHGHAMLLIGSPWRDRMQADIQHLQWLKRQFADVTVHAMTGIHMFIVHR